MTLAAATIILGGIGVWVLSELNGIRTQLKQITDHLELIRAQMTKNAMS